MESSESSLDLSLSYSSSEFESSVNSTEDVQDTSDGVDPYQHEPMTSDSPEESLEDESGDDQRLLNTDWYVASSYS